MKKIIAGLTLLAVLSPIAYADEATSTSPVMSMGGHVSLLPGFTDSINHKGAWLLEWPNTLSYIDEHPELRAKWIESVKSFWGVDAQ